MEDIESIDFCSQIYFPYSELKKDGDSHLEDLAQELVEKEENMTPNLIPKSDLEKPSKRSLTKAKDLDSPDLDSGVRTNVPQLNFNKKKKMKNVANDPFVSARQFSLKSPETDPDEPEPNGDSEISDGSGEDEREESYLSQEENVVRKENSKSKSGSMEAQKDLESDSRSVQNKGSSKAKIKPVFGCPAKNKNEKSSKSSKPRKTEAFKMASKKSKKHESEVESEDAKLLPDTILNTDEDSLFVNSNVCPVKRDSGEGEQIVPSFSRKKPKANSLGKPLHVVKTKQSDTAPQGTKGPGKKVSKKQGLSEISSSVLNSEAQHRRKEGGENNAPGGEKKSRKKTTKNRAEENKSAADTDKCVGDIEEEKKGTPLKKKRKKTDDGVAVAETPKDKNKGPEVRSLIEDFDSELINVECLYPSLNGEIPVDPGSPTASERSEQEKKKNKKKRKSKDEEDEEENEGENEVCKKSVMKKKKEKNKEGNDEGEKEGENKIREKPAKKKKQVKEEEKKEEEGNGIHKKQTKKKRKGKNEEDSQDDEGENEEGNEIGEKLMKKKKKIKEEEEEKDDEEEEEKEICEKTVKKKKKIKKEEEDDEEEEEEKEIHEKTIKKKKKIKEEREENEICKKVKKKKRKNKEDCQEEEEEENEEKNEICEKPAKKKKKKIEIKMKSKKVKVEMLPTEMVPSLEKYDRSEESDLDQEEEEEERDDEEVQEEEERDDGEVQEEEEEEDSASDGENKVPKPKAPQEETKTKSSEKPRLPFYVKKKDEKPKKDSKQTLQKTSKEKSKKKPKSCEPKSTRCKRYSMREREIVDTGTWVQCTNSECLKWRFLHDVQDPITVPALWTCDMNPDVKQNDCSYSEIQPSKTDIDEFIYTKYTEGTVVWARVDGYPWWPAMVEMDPDSLSYFDIETETSMYPKYYHVVFFGKKVSRAWVTLANISQFVENKPPPVTKGTLRLRTREINEAEKLAVKALEVPINTRLKLFSFSNRYKGFWGDCTCNTCTRAAKSKPTKEDSDEDL